MNRTTKSHGVKLILTDLVVPTISDPKTRVRSLTANLMGTNKIIILTILTLVLRAAS